MRRKGKEIWKKIAIILSMVITLISPAGSNISWAAPENSRGDGIINSNYNRDQDDDSTYSEEEIQENEYFEQTSGGSVIINGLGNGIVAIFLTIPKLFVIMMATAIRGITGSIASIGGVNGNANAWDTIWISPEDIIFNKLNITDINFFDVSGLAGPMKDIRENIAVWYYGLRNLAVVMLLAVLVYVGIRMAISVTGEDKAKYKTMLINWFVSFALIFVLHYIMLFTINVNEALVGVFDEAREEMKSEYNVIDLMDKLLSKATFNFGVAGLGATIAYCMLIGLTFVFLFMYIKRMITIAFLIMIAPIITVTYSIDKMGDGKSQALNAWFKEFIYNILIQPFHCLIYLCFVASNISLLNTGTIAGAVLACIFIIFILQAEKIIKNIFDFHAKSMPDGLQMVGVLAAAQMLKKSSKGGGSGGGEKEPSTGTNQNLAKNVKKNPAVASNAGGTSTATSGGTGSGSSGGTGGTGGSGSPTSGGSAPSSPGKVRQIANVAGRRILKGRTATDAGKEYLKKSAGLATRGLMASMAAASGDMSKVTAGWMAGGIINEKAKDKYENHLAKSNEQRLAKSHNDFQKSTGRTDEEMKDFTEEILKTDPTVFASTHTDKDELAYANMVYGQRDIYKAQGYKDDKVNDKVLDTINLVQAGRIQPKLMDEMMDRHY